MVRESLCVFTRHPEVDLVLPVIHPDDTARFAAAAEGLDLAPAGAGCGNASGVGARRARGAAAKPRPRSCWCMTRRGRSPRAALVSRAIAAAAKSGAAVPGLPVTDTVKLVDEQGQVAATLDRSAMRTVQTPQAFAYPALLDAHRRAAARRPRGFSRRCRAGRMGRIAGHDVRGRSAQHEDDHAGGFRPQRARGADGARRYPHRHRLRHPRLRRPAAITSGSAA